MSSDRNVEEVIGEHVRVTSEGGNLVIVIDMKSLIDSLIKSKVDELARALNVRREDVVIRRTQDMKYKIIVPVVKMSEEEEEEL
ncbi:MAG: hypothetical protein QXQ91_03540 [Nanopusillaceae archaeon]